MRKKRFLIAGVVVLVAGLVVAGVLIGVHKKRASDAAKKAQTPLTKTQQDALVSKTIVNNITNIPKGLADSEPDPAKKLTLLIDYGSNLNSSGKQKEALAEFLELEKTYKLALVQNSSLYGQIQGVYEELGDKTKAAEYKQKYIDALKANGHADFAAQVEAQGQSGVQQQ